ncbi:hypothetical protein MYXO_01741 [Myxococcaceae bacterium]|jgi:Zn-finger nucleic acid-binding protein|nr:hypothetical protein MYXO_01741 [Myxococcaceae bacterium]
MKSVFRTLIRCLVCGFAEVRTDEVIDRGLVLLHECPRCRHRWTDRAGDPQRRELARVAAGRAARSAA